MAGNIFSKLQNFFCCGTWKGRIRRRLAILVLFMASVACIAAAGSDMYQAENENGMETENGVSMAEGDAGYECYENRIAITFDDGPRKSTTEKLLDGLKERGVPATFFLVGKNIEGNEQLVRRMHDEGHLIGNHTYSHVQLSTLSKSKAYAEVSDTNDIICSITGEKPKYIRPPYGTYSNKLLMEINMTPVLWSVDPDDWNTSNAAEVVRDVVENVKCGDIILLHDIYDSSVAAALEIIDRLKAKGYVFVTVDQLLLD